MYLSSKNKMGSEIDKSCLMVCLMESGSFQSIWVVIPSVNHKQYGDVVRYSEGLIFKNNLNGYYLHYSMDIPKKRYFTHQNDNYRIKEKSPDSKIFYQSYLKLLEVNTSTTKHEWLIELYRKCVENKNEFIACGDMIRIKHIALNG